MNAAQTEPLAEEVWKDILGFEGYQASTHGRIRSLTRLKVYANGGARWLRGRILKPWRCGEYLQIELAGKTFLVHRLILETFVGPCPPGKECAHWDGVHSNCRPENLRWATRLENTDDRRRHGNIKFNPRKLTAEDVAEIRNIGTSVPVALTAEQFEVSEGHVRAIINGRSWREH